MHGRPSLISVAFWLTVAAVATPLFLAHYLPFTDLPEHVAAMATMSRYFDAASADARTYSIAFWRSQYLLYHGSGALLTRLTGDAVLANRLLLVAVGVALPLSVRSALRALCKDDALAILACMPFLSRPLFIGFLPYMSSMPLFFFGIAAVVRCAAKKERPARVTAALAALAMALLYTHLSIFVVFVPTAITLTLILVAKDGAVTDVRVLLRDATRSVGWLFPACLMATVWSFAEKITIRSDSLWDPSEIGTMGLKRSLRALPLWTFDTFRTHSDEICGGLWWTVLAILAVVAARAAKKKAKIEPSTEAPSSVLRFVRRLDPSYVPLFCLLVVYFATPFRVGAGVMLNVRLAPLVALSAILTVGHVPRAPRNVLLALVTCVTMAYAANAAHEIRSLARNADGLDEVLAAMRPEARLVTLSFASNKTHAHFSPYSFPGSYYRARGGTIAGYSFSDLSHWPVQYRAEAKPPQKKVVHWTSAPCLYRHGVDGIFYDYVLVQDPKVDPFANEPSGPAMREVRRAGTFVLYEKTGGAWIGPDAIGGCAPPASSP